LGSSKRRWEGPLSKGVKETTSKSLKRILVSRRGGNREIEVDCPKSVPWAPIQEDIRHRQALYRHKGRKEKQPLKGKVEQSFSFTRGWKYIKRR